MTILIIEDEYPAAERLQKMLARIPESIEILEVVDSVESAVRWLRNQQAPDLILSDIQLSDGLSFEIFDQVLISSPVIFTTSYDEYAIRAFKLKSIDYLLKPVKKDELQQAIEKYKSMTATERFEAEKIEKLLDNLQYGKKKHKKRFLVKKGERLIPVDEEQIACFHASNEIVFLYTNDGKKYLIDYTLEQLETLINPSCFFRINRQFIVHLQALGDIHVYFSGRLKLVLEPLPQEEVIVSKSRVKKFKEWLEG